MGPSGQDHAVPDRDGMWAEVVAGLSARPKRIPSKYLYDAVGSHLFEIICRTPEYYLARTERSLLVQVAAEVARVAGSGRVVIEPGCGSSDKFMLLAPALAPSGYVPVDICSDALRQAVNSVAKSIPWLPVQPYCGDFQALDFERLPPGRRLIFFPGSTIGNFEPSAAIAFLARLAGLAGRDGGLLIGVDLEKEPRLLHTAYNDRAGITAAFNLNLLARINRELGANFDLAGFEHRARFDAAAGRIEMHLVSRRAQRVHIGQRVVTLAAGETIHTEDSYKYTVEGFRELARQGGWQPLATWTDPERLFSVHYLMVGQGP